MERTITAAAGHQGSEVVVPAGSARAAVRSLDSHYALPCIQLACDDARTERNVLKPENRNGTPVSHATIEFLRSEMAHDLISAFAENRAIGIPIARSQTFTFPSPDPDTIECPSGLTATAMTRRLSPPRVWCSRPASRSQTFDVVSQHPETMMPPSRETFTASIGPVWLRSCGAPNFFSSPKLPLYH